jgi:uncharacterized membrane protein YhaH (DUF805 family)
MPGSNDHGRAAMDFPTAIRTCFTRYVTFTGRARRSEYWYFLLFIILGNLGTGILDAGLGGGGALGAVFALATFLPQLAVTTRRLHDTGRSGWWQVSYLIAGGLAGAAASQGQTLLGTLAGIAAVALLVTVLVWLIRAGTPGANRFGADPAARIMPGVPA